MGCEITTFRLEKIDDKNTHYYFNTPMDESDITECYGVPLSGRDVKDLMGPVDEMFDQMCGNGKNPVVQKYKEENEYNLKKLKNLTKYQIISVDTFEI